MFFTSIDCACCFRGRRVKNKEAWKQLLLLAPEVSPDTPQINNKQPFHALYVMFIEHP